MVEVTKELSRKMANMAFCGAVLVMLIHFPEGNRDGNALLKFLWGCFPGAVLRVAVPFFFCAAGFWLAGHFQDKGWWKQAVSSRIKSLLIPYLVLNAIWTVWMLMYGGIGSLAGNGGILHKFCAAFGWVRGEYPALPHLWFMWRLFLLVLVSPLCWWIIKRGKRVAYTTAAIIYFLLAGRAGYIAYAGAEVPAILMPFKYIIPPVGLVGFMVGTTMRWYGVPQIKRRVGAVLMIAGFAGLLAAHTVVNGAIAKIGLFYVGMPMFLLGVWACMPPITAPKWIVRNTFAIYIFHWIIFWGADHIATALGCREGLNTIGGYLVLPGLAIILSCALAELLKKSPILGRLFLGGR